MTSSGIEFEDIGAYVDGELDAGAAARIAAMAARDPAIAAQIAQLAKLKSLVPDALTDGISPIIDLSRTIAVRRPVWRSWAVAASLVVLTATAATFDPPASMLPQARETSIFDVVQARHRAWTSAFDMGSTGAAASGQGASNMATFVAPDLSDAQLTLRDREVFTLGSARVLLFGYAGTRGCKLSLFVLPDVGSAALPDMPRAVSWQQDGVGYVVMADGMDKRHLGTIVQALREYSIERRPFSGPTADQLVASRSRSRPCVA